MGLWTGLLITFPIFKMDENKVPQCVFVDCLCKLDDPGSQFSTDNCGNLIPGAKHHPQYYLICGYCDHFLKSLHPKRILETEQYDRLY